MCIFFRRQLLKSDYTVWTSNLNEKGKTSPDVEKKNNLQKWQKQAKSHQIERRSAKTKGKVP